MKSNILILLMLAYMLAAASRPADIKSLGMEAGLSSNYIVSIAEDKHGYLWFATEEGLNRFDGTAFRSYYKTRAANGLSGNELNCIIDDPRDPVLWIGTQREGLNAYNYDTGTFTRYRHDPGRPASLITNDITSVRAAADGNIWLTTFWKGLEKLDKQTGRFTHYNSGNVRGMTDNQLWSVLDAGNGIVYTGHVHCGMTIVNTRYRTAVNYRHDDADPFSISGNEVYCIMRDSRNLIWVGTDRGLDLFDPHTGRFRHITDNGRLLRRIFDIREMRDKRLWVGTELGGVAVIALQPGGGIRTDYIPHTPDSGTLYGTVRSIYEDKFGNVWLGLYGEGLNFINNHQPLFRQITCNPSAAPFTMTNKTALSLCIDRNGLLWAGTDGGGIDIFGPGGRMLKNKPAASSVQAIFRDSRGRIWTGLFVGGATVTDNGSTSTVRGLKAGEDVRAFSEAPDGRIFISTSSGIYIADPDSRTVIQHADIGNNLVRSVAFDRHGNIYAATFGDGLYIMSRDLKRTIAHHDAGHGFPSNTVNQVMTGRDGRVWVATGEGLVVFDGTKRYTVYNASRGLNNIHIRSVIEDGGGNIWVGTNKGISCLKKGAPAFINFIYKDNVPVANFSAGSVARGPDGMLYLGSNNGICYFNPSQVLSRRIAPQALINSLTIINSGGASDSIIDPATTRNIRLRYSENTFSVSFSVKNFALANEVEYAYFMNGLSRKWTETDDGSITFRDVRPGSYRLEVRSRFRNQPWNTRSAVLYIDIAPPLWLTWWAKLGYTLAAAAIVWLLMRSYSHKLHLEYLLRSEKQVREKEQKLNEERMRFFTNITHELRTPLTLIMAPLDELAHDRSISPDIKKRVVTIHNSATKLYNLISKILDFRKAESDRLRLSVGRGNVVAIIREMFERYEQLNTNADVRMTFGAGDEIINLYFDKEVLETILNNLVSNAMKYTPRGTIAIRVDRVETDGRQWVEISVSDTGYGISASALPHIFERYYQERGPHQASGTGIGLALVKSLVDLHEGTISVESKPGKGSTFRVRLLAGNSYDNSPHVETAAPETPAETASSSAAPQTEGEAGRKRRIMLVVEDNHDICRYIADCFSDEFEIRMAANGREGLDVAQSVIPDIIISDVMMPVMDGNKMCRTLKNNIKTSHIPVILLTARDSMTDKEEGYMSGADSYITKPFVKSLLLSRVHNLLYQRQLLVAAYGKQVGNRPEASAAGSELRKSMGTLDRDFLDRLDSLISANLQTGDFDIDSIAGKMGMSNSTLYRKINALTAMSPNEYVRKFRMRQAAQLLATGNLTVAEAGYRVGITTTAYFRKLFKDEFGMTPSEYVRNIKAGSQAADT